MRQPPAPTPDARQRLATKLRAFSKGLPTDEQQVLTQLLTMRDVHGGNEDGEYGVSVTAPSFEAVITTRLLELPEFERTASFGDAVTDTGPGLESGVTAQVERNT